MYGVWFARGGVGGRIVWSKSRSCEVESLTVLGCRQVNMFGLRSLDKNCKEREDGMWKLYSGSVHRK